MMGSTILSVRNAEMPQKDTLRCEASGVSITPRKLDTVGAHVILPSNLFGAVEKESVMEPAASTLSAKRR
jgi:hypothetical protein